MTPRETRDDKWLATVIRRAETVEECQLTVTMYLLEKNKGQLPSLHAGASPSTSQFARLRVVPPVTDDNNATV